MKIISLILCLIFIVLFTIYFIFNYLKNIKKYRIISYTYPYYDYVDREEATSTKYISQKRFLGFLWWEDLDNCYTLKEAQISIKYDIAMRNKEIVE